MIVLKELEEDMSTTATKFLPPEIVMEILSWLPAKSLLTSFKLVSKAWLTLIQDPDFIQIHLNRGALHGGRSLIRKPIFGNALFQLRPRLNCDQPPFIFKDLPIAVATNLGFDLLLPLISKVASSSRLTSTSRLVGSCNGLLCISLDYNVHIVILNPSTRKYKVSPKEPIKCPVQFKFGHVTYGFGCFHSEYRVVRIACFYPRGNDDDDDDPRCGFQMDIYSMSSNSWRWVTCIPPHKRFGHQSSGVFLNEVVHWMGANHGSNDFWDTIVSFNMEAEEFGQISMAPCVVLGCNGYNNDDVVLMNWRGYLGMIGCSRYKRMDIDLEIWVMKEYGIGESWTKEFVIRTSDSDPLGGELPAGFLIISRRIMTCFWTDDQILIQGIYELVPRRQGATSNQWRIYGRLVLYDMNRKKINENVLMVDIPSEPRDEQADYIDTLVSLNSSLLPLNKQ